MYSTTKLLPAWKACLEDAELASRIFPCDVLTQWNSTYDILCFAVEYHQPIESLTSDHKNNLCMFELNKNEWSIAQQLKDILEVRDMPMVHCYHIDAAHLILDLEGHNLVFLVRNPQSCNSYPHNGPHQHGLHKCLPPNKQSQSSYVSHHCCCKENSEQVLLPH